MTITKIVVIKCGGSIINDELIYLIDNISKLIKMKYKIIVVHGGGNDIKTLADALHIKSIFIKGLRVTSSEMIEIVKMILLGKINVNLVHKLNIALIPALGLSGHDMKLLIANYIDKEELGFVGAIKKVNTKFLNQLLEQKFVPIIAPLAIDNNGNTLNINADLAASAIASAICAEELFLLTDVDGLYSNYADKDSLISLITTSKLKTLLKNENGITNGMIPKLNACIEAVDNQTNCAYIINGKIKYDFLEIILGKSFIGTKIIKEDTLC